MQHFRQRQPSTIALRAVVEGKTTWEEVNRVITH
jgi:general secretion pathway protein E